MARRRVAIIGLGMAAPPHARSLAALVDRVEVAACFSRSEARRRAFAEQFALPTTDDLDGILADRSIEAVLLLTPPNTHLDLVERSAAAGKHILLEKPLEVTPERARRVVAVMERAGLTLGVVFQFRFRAAAQRLAGLVAQGRLGRLLMASAAVHWWRPDSYFAEPGRGMRARDGGGVLFTQAIHTLDLFLSLAGTPDEVTAHAVTSPLRRIDTEDIVSATLRFSSGTIGCLEATTVAYPGLPETIVLAGTAGTARLTGQHLQVWLKDGTVIDERRAKVGTGGGADPMAFSHEAHQALHTDFLDAIDDGRAPRTSGREALKVHALIDALLCAARQGGAVQVTV